MILRFLRKNVSCVVKLTRRWEKIYIYFKDTEKKITIANLLKKFNKKSEVRGI